MPRVLITTEVLRELPGEHLDLLRAAGLEVQFPVKSVLSTEQDVLEAMPGFVAVIAGSEPYNDRVLAGLPDLRVISRNGVGYDKVDIPAATRRGVAVTITPDGNYLAVAEHAFALLLAVARNIAESTRETRGGTWQRRSQLIPLRGRTLGIVGLGRIGRGVATRAKAFGLRVLAYEPRPDLDFVQQQGIELVELVQLFTASDFVTLHTPLTSATKELINRRSLALMKPGSILINTARGGLVNEADLYDALSSGHLAGAGLDVLAVEPPLANHPLLSLDNLTISPHVASLDEQAIQDMSLAAAHNIIEVLAGRHPGSAL